MAKKTKEYAHRYKNGFLVRLDKKRISVFEKNEKVNILIQAILPQSELNFTSNFIRGNYKQTAFSLTKESAIALQIALTDVLNQIDKP